MMQSETEDCSGHCLPRQRTLSQQSSQSSKFPLLSSESGLYTCSSSNSEYIESDSEVFQTREGFINENVLQLALQEARRLRSDLDRLTKSEQWYKQELRQQKAIRLADLERIYTQERKFLEENQRLQKECVRLYDKCSQFEEEIERQRKKSISNKFDSNHSMGAVENATDDFDVQQQLCLIKDNQLLIGVLRQQKKKLLEELKNLSQNKDKKVMEMERLLADLEFDNKQITKRCADLLKERSDLKNSLNQKDSEINLAAGENINLQRILNELREQHETQKVLIRVKEDENTRLQDKFRNRMQNEQDLDEVHRISLNYHEEVISKSLEIKTLKNQLCAMQHEIDQLQEFQSENDHQKRRIEQLNSFLEASTMELHEIRQTDAIKTKQIEDMQKVTEELMQDKLKLSEEHQMQQQEFVHMCQELKTINEECSQIQRQYKETKFKLELLELDHGKLKFEKDNDEREISLLRQKLALYLQQISKLTEIMQKLKLDLERTVQENLKLKENLEDFKCASVSECDQCQYKNHASKDLSHLELQKNVNHIQSHFKTEESSISNLDQNLDHLTNKHVSNDNIVTRQNTNTINTPELLKWKQEIDDSEMLAKPFTTIEKGDVSHKQVQCDIETADVVEHLKAQIVEFQRKECMYVEEESRRRDQRIHLLQQLVAMHNSKILCMQNSQKDVQELLHVLNSVQVREEESKRELELKRRELEELNYVFEKQNEELRKLEELTAQIALKESQEKQQKSETRNDKSDRSERQEMEKCGQESNSSELLIINEQTQEKTNEARATDVLEFMQEMRCLKDKAAPHESDKEEFLQHICLLDGQIKCFKNLQTYSILMPQTPSNELDLEVNNPYSVKTNGKVSVDHFRILTKVLEAECDRKMRRYDQHIRSLLSNVRNLKKSLKANEQKTALLEEEQSRTITELNEMQRMKRTFEDMRLKYGESQNTINELKKCLEESTQNQISSYEVPNLIDDYKKLIHQSSTVTKRPTTCSVLDLIQRSSQCVPNLHKIESNLEDLRSDLQRFLTTCSEKGPNNSALLNPATFSLPPSLMDELRVASDGY